MRALILALALAAFPALAGDLVIRNKETGAEIRLLDTACSHGGTLGVIKPEFRAQFKNLRLRPTRNDLIYGCWIQVEDEVVLIFEDGSDTTMKMAAFSDPMS